MEESAIQLYAQLALADKRNEFSSLLLKIDELINVLIAKENMNAATVVKNYDKNLHSNLTEDETLVFFFQDLVSLKNKLIALIAVTSNKK